MSTVEPKGPYREILQSTSQNAPYPILERLRAYPERSLNPSSAPSQSFVGTEHLENLALYGEGPPTLELRTARTPCHPPRPHGPQKIEPTGHHAAAASYRAEVGGGQERTGSDSEV